MQEDKSYRKVIRNWQIKAFRLPCSICYETLRAFHRFGCRPDLQSMLGLALNLQHWSFFVFRKPAQGIALDAEEAPVRQHLRT